MDAFYEESAVNKNAEKGERNYKVLHYVSWVFFFIGIVLAIISIMTIPIKPSTGAENYEEAMGYYSAALVMCLIFVSLTIFFFMLWFILFRLKQKVNVNYDYVFVSGELRISKVFNVNKRKLAERIDCEDIIQIGDVENTSFDRLRSSPDTKVVYFTQNNEPAEGKFFMYILANSNGKKLFVLECRELLLMNIMKFTRRTALESDYVMQERKQQKTTV